MATKKKTDAEIEMELQHARAGEFAKAARITRKVFGADFSPDLVEDVYDYMPLEGDDAETADFVLGLQKAQATCVELYGEGKFTTKNVLGLYDRVIVGVDEDEDEDDYGDDE